jgi:hypothetical protein
MESHGFHLTGSLSKEIKWIGKYYSDNILSQLLLFGCRQSSTNDRPCR